MSYELWEGEDGPGVPLALGDRKGGTWAGFVIGQQKDEKQLKYQLKYMFTVMYLSIFTYKNTFKKGKEALGFR